MAQAVNIQTQQLEDVPQDQLPSALINQTHGLAPGSEVDMFHPDGRLASVPAESVQQALQSGFRFPTGAEVTELSNQAKFGGVENAAKAAFQGYLRGSTLGLSDLAYKAISPELAEENRQLKERHPIASTVGELGGIVSDPIGALQGIGQIAKIGGEGAKVIAEGLGVDGSAGANLVSRIVGQAVDKGVEGAITGGALGAGNVVSEYALGNPQLTAESAAHHILMSGLFGAGIGGTLGFASEAIPAAVEGSKEALSKLGDTLGVNDAVTSLKNKVTDAYANVSSVVSGMKPDEIRAVIANRGKTAIPLTTEELSGSLDGLYKETDKAFDTLQKIQLDAVNPQILDSFEDAQTEFEKRFMYKVKRGAGIEYKVDPVKVENFIKNIGSAQGAVRADALSDFANSSRIMTDHIEDLYKVFPDNYAYTSDTLNKLLDKNEELIQKGHEAATINRMTRDAINQQTGGGIFGGLAGAAAGHAAGLGGLGTFGVGTAVAGVANLLKNPVLTAQRLARVEEMIQKTGNQFARGAELLSNSKLPSAAFLKGYVGTKAASLTEDQYSKESDKIRNLASNPDALTGRLAELTQPLADHAPDTVSQLNKVGGNAVMFLNSKLPPKSQSPLAAEPQPSQAEISKFSRYYRAVQNPVNIVKSAVAGKLTNEEIETLQSVYPGLQSKLSGQIVQNLSKNKNRTELPYQKRLMLSALTGQNLDGSLAPLAVLKNQGAMAFANAQQQQKEAAFMGAGKVRAKGLDNLNFNTRELTAQQKSNRRIE